MGIGDWGLGIGDWGLGIGDWVRNSTLSPLSTLSTFPPAPCPLPPASD
ncbi:hypothetical protein [Nostoc sp. CMAA1605]|nr:hypothetical protein [Nostoc sp. CMAA1605]